MSAHRARHPREAHPFDVVAELRADRRNERLMAWRGLLAAVVVLVVVLVRGYWLG